jgi:hypothetical protein
MDMVASVVDSEVGAGEGGARARVSKVEALLVEILVVILVATLVVTATEEVS